VRFCLEQRDIVLRHAMVQLQANCSPFTLTTSLLHTNLRVMPASTVWKPGALVTLYAAASISFCLQPVGAGERAGTREADMSTRRQSGATRVYQAILCDVDCYAGHRPSERYRIM
jgi:hypothetical protein